MLNECGALSEAFVNVEILGVLVIKWVLLSQNVLIYIGLIYQGFYIPLAWLVNHIHVIPNKQHLSQNWHISIQNGRKIMSIIYINQGSIAHSIISDKLAGQDTYGSAS